MIWGYHYFRKHPFHIVSMCFWGCRTKSFGYHWMFTCLPQTREVTIWGKVRGAQGWSSSHSHGPFPSTELARSSLLSEFWLLVIAWLKQHSVSWLQFFDIWLQLNLIPLCSRIWESPNSPAWSFLIKKIFAVVIPYFLASLPYFAASWVQKIGTLFASILFVCNYMVLRCLEW